MLALLEFNDRMTAFRRLEFIKNQEDKTRQTRHNNARVWSSELISQVSAIKHNLFLWIEHSSQNAGLAENYEHLTSASFHFFLSACWTHPRLEWRILFCATCPFSVQCKHHWVCLDSIAVFSYHWQKIHWSVEEPLTTLVLIWVSLWGLILEMSSSPVSLGLGKLAVKLVGRRQRLDS